MNPIHRDDVPYDIVEEIERLVREQHPDMKIQFAGDLNDPDIAQKAQLLHEKLLAKAKKSYKHGTCVDCEAVMPDYQERLQTKEIAPGWSHFADQSDVFMGWLCPDCQEKEDKPTIRPIFLLEDDDET